MEPVMTIHIDEKMTIHIIRHGETSWNVLKKIQGHMDIALNDKGREQAKRLVKKLEKVSLSHCYTSDLLRATETAEIALNGSEIDTYKDRRLRERTFGKWEGKFFDDYYAAGAIRGGEVETDTSMQERLKEFITHIIQNHSDEEVLVSTHGGVVRNLLALITDLDIEKIHVKNTAYVRIAYINGAFNVEELDGVTTECDCGHHGS
jgi:broad specificity phosphatase PhoE